MRCFKKEINRFKNSDEKGFTLVEVLVAMSLLMMIVFAFTPLFLGSLRQIMLAGERTDLIYLSQAEMEKMLAEKEAYRGAGVPIKINGYERIVRGGLVETAEFGSLLPWLPTISLSPDILVEGYPAAGNINRIEITGTDSNFAGGTSQCTIVNDYGYSYSPPLYINNSETAYFFLPTGANRLKNAGAKYRVVITTGDETVRARLGIRLPQFLIVGNQYIGVSKTGTFWESGPELEVEFNNVVWGGGLFVAVGNGGKIYTLEDGLDWTLRTSGVSEDLNGIIWTGEGFLAVGNNGTILSSPNGKNWTRPITEAFKQSLTGYHLNDIVQGAVAINDTFAAITVIVGDNGLVITRKEDDWDAGITAGGVNLNSVIYYGGEEGSYRFMAAGDVGTIVATSDPFDINSWECFSPDFTNNNLNALNWHTSSEEDSGFFIAVGDQGIILLGEIKAPELFSWSSKGSATNRDLNDIETGISDGNFIFVAVGDQVITTSLNANDWSAAASTKNLKGIASRR